jgi:hypothetical protein
MPLCKPKFSYVLPQVTGVLKNEESHDLPQDSRKARGTQVLADEVSSENVLCRVASDNQFAQHFFLIRGDFV